MDAWDVRSGTPIWEVRSEEKRLTELPLHYHKRKDLNRLTE